MTDGDSIHEGQVLTGPLFSEPMRVETVAASGPATWTVGLVGTQSERFGKVVLTKDQLATLTVTSGRTSLGCADVCSCHRQRRRARIRRSPRSSCGFTLTGGATAQ